MNDPLLFVIGLFITLVTVAGVVVVGRAEAKDPAHNRMTSGPDSS